VAERLGEVAEQLARLRIHLLGEQPDVVGVVNRPLTGLLCAFDLSRKGKRLGQPERADEEARNR
jgi:hypothetical protein